MGTAIFYPIFGQFLLTFFLLLRLGAMRRRALLARETTLADIALDDSRWPDDARKIAYCYRNQFELPVIFYVACLVAFETGAAGTLMVALAWAFVTSRIVHAYIHTTSNRVNQRGAAFAVGFLIVVIMTMLLIGHLLFAAV